MHREQAEKWVKWSLKTNFLPCGPTVGGSGPSGDGYSGKCHILLTDTERDKIG